MESKPGNAWKMGDINPRRKLHYRREGGNNKLDSTEGEDDNNQTETGNYCL